MDEPERIMLAWTALEVLSPQTFERPEKLAGGEIQRIARFSDRPLPWENGGEKSRPNYRLYYQVVLGSIQMEPAITQLLTVYTDHRDERPQAKGESVLATLLVDRNGRLVELDAIAISSFGWGLPIALQGDLKSLGDWQKSEAALLEAFDKKIRRVGEDGELLPLTRSDIENAYSWVAAQLGLDGPLLVPPSFAVRSYQYFKIDEPPEALLLNSFYLGDLDRARSLFQTKSETENLKRYVGSLRPTSRRSLLVDEAAITDALHPSRMPLGRWPARGRHPLVALQQAAVNLAATDLKTGGILAVNGPPGTGKTTLLRDVVAHVVTERAKVMALFDDPEDAFANSKLRVKKGNAFLWMYKLDKRLRGFEIVVASSNNKAVENVSAELPDKGAIAIDAFAGGYLKTVSDALLGRDTWGLIAAVLGNASNRAKFRQQFWWDDDTGMSRYLQHASGTPFMITLEDKEGKKKERSPDTVIKENPPSDKIEALKRWKSAKRKFLDAEKAARSVLAEAAKVADYPKQIEEADIEIGLQGQLIAGLAANVESIRRAFERGTSDEAMAVRDAEAANRLAHEIGLARPGIFNRLFKRSAFREWQQRSRDARHSTDVAASALKTCRADLARLFAQFTEGNSKYQKSIENFAQLESRQEDRKEELKRLRGKTGGQPIDESYFAFLHHERQLVAPWLNSASSLVRDSLFEAAINLQRAFVDAAAKPIRHNLGLLMDSFGSRSFGTSDKDVLIPDLWSSLFLVVPVVSTTFASVARMFARLGPNELGWLLIDEAGQALPQAAVGAIMRSARAVVVGDPLQIEPVVMLPDQLTEAICREFKIDETRFNAPAASAQTLSDAATSWFAAFETKTGSRDVGVPLLVHRRCEEPMFGISNSIAYENLMVQAKTSKRSQISEVLGPSAWRHVVGSGQDKWCAEEGEVVIELLSKLKANGVNPDVYVVTPFVVVQDRLRERIKNSGILNGWVENPARWPFERVGTVHTVQGREAEAVILVLGAPLANQTGARNWAGSRPNLLNVAVSRAQEVLYVVGNRMLWEKAGVFANLVSTLKSNEF